MEKTFKLSFNSFKIHKNIYIYHFIGHFLFLKFLFKFPNFILSLDGKQFS